MRTTLLLLCSATSVLALENGISAVDTIRYILPEQTITGSRIEQRWMDNATAITTLNREAQPHSTEVNLTDNLLLIPGLSANSRYGTDDMRLAIRGLGARSDTGIRGVRVLVDGIPETEPDGQGRLEGIDPGTIHKLEVLRGSGSAMYGNAAGGVINLLTSETLPTAGAQAEFSFSENGYARESITIGSGPVATDTAISLSVRNESLKLDAGPTGGEGGRLTFSHTKSDGWRDHSAYESWNFSGSWTVRSDRRSSLRALLDVLHVRNELPGTLTPEQFAEDPYQAEEVYQSLDLHRQTRKGRIGLRYTRQLSSAWNIEFTPHAVVKKLDRPRSKGPEFRLLTRYVLGGTFQAHWKGEVSGRPVGMVTGFDEQFQDGPITTYSMTDTGTRTDTLTRQEQKGQWAQGVFLEASSDITSRISASLGARFDHVYFREEDQTEGLRVTNDEHAVTPRLGLRWKARSDLTAFGSVYGGFETPSRKEVENTVGFNVEPQKLLTGELGVRSERMMGGVESRLEVTAYHMTITDMIVPDVLAGEELFTNAGEAVHMGIELSAKLSKRRLGFLGLAASFGDFHFTDYVTAEGDFTDKKLPGVSPDLISAVLRWTPTDVFYLEGTVKRSGSAFADIGNTVQADAWTIVGSAIGGRLPLDFMSGSWHLGISNIFDEQYVSFIQVNDSHARYFDMGMPCTVFGGITLGTPGL